MLTDPIQHASDRLIERREQVLVTGLPAGWPRASCPRCTPSRRPRQGRRCRRSAIPSFPGRPTTGRTSLSPDRVAHQDIEVLRPTPEVFKFPGGRAAPRDISQPPHPDSGSEGAQPRATALAPENPRPAPTSAGSPGMSRSEPSFLLSEQEPPESAPRVHRPVRVRRRRLEGPGGLLRPAGADKPLLVCQEERERALPSGHLQLAQPRARHGASPGSPTPDKSVAACGLVRRARCPVRRLLVPPGPPGGRRARPARASPWAPSGITAARRQRGAPPGPPGRPRAAPRQQVREHVLLDTVPLHEELLNRDGPRPPRSPPTTALGDERVRIVRRVREEPLERRPRPVFYSRPAVVERELHLLAPSNLRREPRPQQDVLVQADGPGLVSLRRISAAERENVSFVPCSVRGPGQLRDGRVRVFQEYVPDTRQEGAARVLGAPLPGERGWQPAARRRCGGGEDGVKEAEIVLP